MIEKLDLIPPSGTYDEISFDIQGPWKGVNWNYVLFTKSDGDQWCGFFREGDWKNFLVAELKEKSIACIISGGHGYIIDIENKMKIKNISEDLIIDLIVDEHEGIFYIAGQQDIYYINDNYEEIRVDLPIATDEIKFDSIEDRKLNLKLMEINCSGVITKNYSLDLDNKKLI